MDRAFRLPFTRIRLGWDSIIGLVPGVGDTLALAPAAWIVSQAHQAGAPRHILGQMGVNIGIDWVIGLLPLIGDLLDVGYKANTRNAALLRTWVEARHRDAGGGVAEPADYRSATSV
ncbi:uncharacterized protein DUF4112 [Salipiger aestuarii]|uniref:Uncharacterized protein DUF4112 n=2 Tax=Salipiger aestuarii TaxID=568098 RepID=A0A327Y1P3_9RHOB|nr:DUF4112 domain-containing protein [Salipiger aestuarii]EIE50529.1 transmembrane prediction [Citreicella sp. 357]RAK15030.1 uncharacterized protein DUF4112 [Salipiger aestuarii]